MSAEKELLELEFELWETMKADTGREAFFRERLIDDAMLTVLAPLEMMTRETCISEAAKAPAVIDFHLAEPRVISLTEDSAIVVYRMAHRRVGGEELAGGVASVYVRREGVWRLAYHQVTPYESIRPKGS